MNAKSIKIIFCLFLAALVAIAVILSAALAARCAADVKDKTGAGEIKESTETLNNPDQGFYRPVYTKVTETGVKPNGNINSAARLYHLRMDISAFSAAAGGADKPLTQAALDGIDGLLADMRRREKNAVIRFAYAPEFGGMKNAEPEFGVMLNHVRQICGVLNNYGSVITAVEVGLIGPCGEMHSSAIANKEHISPLIDEFLTQTKAQGTAVLVRTPKMIYDYIGITEGQAEHRLSPTDKAYRLGLFNDGYLGSSSDLGTYADRERDVAFLSAQNAHLPYGGEATIPESPLHDIDKCLPEMRELKLSYLNVEWNDKVIEKWKSTEYTRECGGDKRYYGQTAFTYIENRLGYRLVLTGCALSYAEGKLCVKAEIANVGFGNMLKEKRVKIIAADAEGNAAYALDAGVYRGGEELDLSVPCGISAGSYRIYLCLYGDEEDGVPLYTVRLANEDIWNGGLKANALGAITVK